MDRRDNRSHAAIPCVSLDTIPKFHIGRHDVRQHDVSTLFGPGDDDHHRQDLTERRALLIPYLPDTGIRARSVRRHQRDTDFESGTNRNSVGDDDCSRPAHLLVTGIKHLIAFLPGTSPCVLHPPRLGESLARLELRVVGNGHIGHIGQVVEALRRRESHSSSHGSSHRSSHRARYGYLRFDRWLQRKGQARSGGQRGQCSDHSRGDFLSLCRGGSHLVGSRAGRRGRHSRQGSGYCRGNFGANGCRLSNLSRRHSRGLLWLRRRCVCRRLLSWLLGNRRLLLGCARRFFRWRRCLRHPGHGHGCGEGYSRDGGSRRDRHGSCQD